MLLNWLTFASIVAAGDPKRVSNGRPIVSYRAQPPFASLDQVLSSKWFEGVTPGQIDSDHLCKVLYQDEYLEGVEVRKANPQNEEISGRYFTFGCRNSRPRRDEIVPEDGSLRVARPPYSADDITCCWTWKCAKGYHASIGTRLSSWDQVVNYAICVIDDPEMEIEELDLTDENERTIKGEVVTATTKRFQWKRLVSFFCLDMDCGFAGCSHSSKQ